MSGTELIMGMGEVINYLKDLESENKKLKEENKELKEEVELKKDAWCPELLFKDLFENTNYEPTHTIIQYIQMIEEENKKLKEHYDKTTSKEHGWANAEFAKKFEAYSIENEELKEENKKLKRANELNAELHKTSEETIRELEEENKKLKYDLYELNDIAAERGSHNEALEEERVRLQLQNEQLQQDIKELKEEFIDDDSESEEEKTKYDGDDWAYGYGFTIKDGEYRICMAGGGAHWTDYVMNKNGCFIHNTDGMKKVRTFVSCPEGNLIKVYDYRSVLEGDIKLDEGETDMYEMVKECYEEEIMNYEKEEDHIPTDSDEEDSDDPDEE